MAALLFKVGTLGIKTLAKPLATRFQSYVLGHPVLRRQVIGIAQVNRLFAVDRLVDRRACTDSLPGKAYAGEASAAPRVVKCGG
jgi:Optic atrophy 3 protein (OPA3)